MMNVLMATANVNMGSGASWSFFNLVKYVRASGLNPIVVVVKEGELYQKLLDESITVYAVEQDMSTWIVPAYFSSDPIDVIINDLRKIKGHIHNYKSSNKIKRIMSDEKIDLVYMNSLTEFLCAEVARSMNIKVIWHIREFMEEDLNVKFFKPRYAYKLIRNSNAIIAISKAVQAKFEELVGKEINLIYNGIPVEKFYFQHDIFSSEIVNIAISGRITETKGHLELVQAIGNLVKKNYRNIRCNIFGEFLDNEYTRKIQAFIKENGLEEYIIFRGFYEDVSLPLREMDILCVCSWKEAFGRVTIEGMLEGLLVLGANTGGTLELIDDGTTGILFNAKDVSSLTEKLEFILLNKDSMIEIAKNGQKNALEKYNDRLNAERVIKLFNVTLN